MCRPKDNYLGILAKAKIEALEAELRGVQIAYVELKKEYEEYKEEMVDLALERDLYC